MSFSWLASTCTAAPVVKPFTSDSLSSDARLPSCRALISTICRPHTKAAAVTTWLAVYASPSGSASAVAAGTAAYVCTSFSVITLTTDSVPTEMCRDVPNTKYTSVGKTAM